METMRLGGNIELTGFSDIDSGSMVVLKKIIGNYAKRFFGECKKFEKLSLRMDVPKEVEQANQKSLFELKGFVTDAGSEYSSHAEGSNVFFAVDAVLKDLEKNFEHNPNVDISGASATQ